MMAAKGEDCLVIQPDGRIREYRDLIATLIQRRKALGLTQLEADLVSGLEVGYFGKIEISRFAGKGRRLGRVSLPLLLETLGVSLALVDDEGNVLPSWKSLKGNVTACELGFTNLSIWDDRPADHQR